MDVSGSELVSLAFEQDSERGFGVCGLGVVYVGRKKLEEVDKW